MRCSLPAFSLFILLCFLFACDNKPNQHVRSLDELQEWIRPEYALKAERVWQALEAAARHTGGKMYADRYVREHYGQPDAPLIWLTPEGITDQADTLLTFLAQANDMGLTATAFHADTLQRLLSRIHNFNFEGTTANAILGQTEFLLTQALMRYACGQRFGFIHPRRVFNHLLPDIPASGETRTTVVYRQIFDQGNEEPTDSFIRRTMDEVRNHRVGDFLRQIQPTSPLYQQMQQEYLRAQSQNDTTRSRMARINMERARWRYPHPSGGRYIWVNLAGQELTAVDTERDTLTTMRVCCGNWNHKTPLLHSVIRHVELNPYWVIPQTIVRKEIIPNHTGDSAYFARNHYQAINKETKEEVNPATLSASDLRSARFTLRQERGSGNSLGRIIFRFPNNFSVYLHDTNNRGAFQRANRAISHGCVRVERPLDLALFFLDNPKPLFIDRIRMAIDLPPLTPEGRNYQEAHPDARPMPSFSYDRPVPVWIDYWTLYPTPKGTLQSFSDPYGYDKVIEKNLDEI